MRLCLFLLIAGLLDAILTHFGISLGLIEEGNPMMKQVIDQSWFIFYLIKIVLPLTLIGLFWIRPFTGWTRTFLVSACILYFSVLCYHTFWIVLAFS